MQHFVFEQETQGIHVRVIPVYLEDQSSPEDGQYVWAYNVRVENRSDHTVQLINRYWHITDMYGRVQEVSGPGVIGLQPTLAPGESFEYTSGCPLSSPSGFMRGHYEMLNHEHQSAFEAIIPTFPLDLPEKTAVRH
jgi:ApaG protein